MNEDTISSKEISIETEDTDVDCNLMVDGQDSLSIVGIGASAGGLEALQEMVKNLKPTGKATYIIAQHLSPTYKSMMVDLLSKDAGLPITEAQHNHPLEADIIYVCPPNNNIAVLDDKIKLSKPEATRHGPKPNIDILFESIAESKGGKAIGVILSGTGRDGARGIRIIKSVAGFTFVQDPNSAKYDGMPNASIQTTKVDFILPADQIGIELQDILLYPRSSNLLELSGQDESIYQMIFNKLKETMKIDFGLYKKNTLHRRIERRMATLKIDSLSSYNNYLQKNFGEAELLYKNILIGVTSFYRDFKAFDIVRRVLSERLDAKAEKIIRVWVPGCSTGEEAYTLAIVISDILRSQRTSWKVQIFATDIDEDALNIARKGSYPESALMPIDKQHQEHFFSVYDDQFLVDKSIREMVIFSRHDILSDPPFLKLDLITCRNLLIYLNAETQKKILPMFHYALNHHGLLMLGKSESIGQFHNYFKTMDNRWRIYQANYLGEDNTTPGAKIDHHRLYQYRRAPVEHAPSVKTLRDIFISKIQEYVMPMCLLINETQDIIYSGGKNPYLSRPIGVSSDNLMKNIHPQLVTEVRIALQKASKEQAPAKTPYIKVKLYPDVERFVRVLIVPVDASSENDSATLLSFHEENPDEPLLSNPAIDTSKSNDEVIKQLENELLRTQNQMQTLVEELETSNEELQSLNEELQSANEELQSTNEELETTNEELQSTNEELQTAYSELRASYTEQEKKTHALTKVEKELIETNRQFALAQQFGKIGHFYWDIMENDIQWSREMFRIFDIKEQVHNPTLQIILSRVHSDDKARVEQEIAHSYDTGVYNMRHRLQMDNGDIKHVQANGKVYYNDTDTPARMIGTVQDITELVHAQQEADFFNLRMETLMNNSLIGVYLYNIIKGNNSYINDTYTRITGYTLDDLNKLGSDEFMQLFHPEDLKRIADHMGNVSHSRDGEVLQVQYRFLHRNGHWIKLQSCDTVFRFDPTGKAIEFMGSFVEVADPNQSR